MPQLTEEQSTLEGTVSSIIFQNEENGYTILRLDAGEEEVTAVGCMPGVSPGETLELQGQWGRHPSYGEQFKADVITRRMPVGEKAILRISASGAVKGIRAGTALRIIQRFGAEAPWTSLRTSRTSSPRSRASPPSAPGTSARPSASRWGCAVWPSSCRSTSCPLARGHAAVPAVRRHGGGP